MNVALDIGSSGLRALHRTAERLKGRKTPAFYVMVPADPAERRLLEKVCVPFSSCENSYIVFGHHAVELSQSLKLPLIPVFPGGRLPEQDPVGRQIAATMIESLVPRCGVRAGTCGLILPGNPVAPANASDPLLGFVQRLLTLRGYHTMVVHSALACVLADLDDQGFSGVGVSVGAGFAGVTIAINGRSLGEWTVRRGCDQLDETFARSRGRFLFDSCGNKYLDLGAVSRWRMGSPIDLANPRTDDEDLLRSLTREWLTSVLREIGQQIELTGVSGTLPPYLGLVVGGGPARMTGFDQLVAEAMHRTQFPVRISEVRSGRSSEFNLARGCLIAVELETRSTARSA